MTTSNEFYSWYKALTEIKRAYPEGSKVTYQNCGVNVMVMYVTGETSKQLVIYINMGNNTNNYMMNPGSGYSLLKTINNAPTNMGGDIGGKTYSVAAWVKE